MLNLNFKKPLDYYIFNKLWIFKWAYPKSHFIINRWNFQNRFHDLELDWLFEIQGPRSKFQVLGWAQL